jgi:serine/threonine protein kinase
MSPEKISGNLKYEDIEQCKRTDIWSIGVLLY